jgi:hypothetical protein
MALDLTALEAELTRDDSVTDSAVTLITQLMAEVEANKGNPAAIQAIVDRVKGSTDKLAAAVAAGTPGAPPAGRR